MEKFDKNVFFFSMKTNNFSVQNGELNFKQAAGVERFSMWRAYWRKNKERFVTNKSNYGLNLLSINIICEHCRLIIKDIIFKPLSFLSKFFLGQICSGLKEWYNLLQDC